MPRWRVPSLSRSRALTVLVTAMLFCLSGRTLDASSSFDSVYRFRSLRTAHFIVHFHYGEERLADRLARIAEETWQALNGPLGTVPPRLTHVVLVDQSDLSDGYASFVPRDTIVISAVSPSGSEWLKADDWLRVVFTHEFTHIVHLDRSPGWSRAVRGAFGRVLLAFPNAYLPTWQVEGLATYQESIVTGDGRLHAGDFRAIVDEAARAHRFEPLGRVNGGLTDWPGGHAPYAYGLGFHAYLADTYGRDTIATLANETARRVPFTFSRAFDQVYGQSLGALWRDYEAAVRRSLTPVPAAAAERLTFTGYYTSGPRFAPGDCGRCPAAVIYSVRTPSAFPAIYRLSLDGTAPRRLSSRYLGSTIAPGGQTIYFDQIERRREAGRYSDLYALDPVTGRVRRVTRDERIQDPDLSPDGRSIVAVQNAAPGRRDLVLVDVSSGARSLVSLILSAPDTQFNAPRWSPDGRAIVAERHRPGQPPEIVVVDLSSRSTRVVARDSHARWTTPAWRPDGQAIVAAADFDEGPFNLYEIDPARGDIRPLTQTTGGATWPDVSPDGRSIVYVGYGVDGFDLYRMPYPSGTTAGDGSRAAITTTEESSPLEDPVPVEARAYSPWATLVPTAWWPMLDRTSTRTQLGAATEGGDVLDRHAYGLSVSWLVSRPKDAPGPHAAVPDWHAAYAYTRWRPTVYAVASRETSFFSGPPDADGVPLPSIRRRRQIEVGVSLPISHVRVVDVARVSLIRASDAVAFADRTVALDRSAARVAWSMSSAHVYGRSISPEGGVTAGATAEFTRRAIGAAADATTYTGDVRAYLPGARTGHVFAVRVSGGSSVGEKNLRQTFLLGGSFAQPIAAFSGDGFSLLRGFAPNTFAGTAVALVNADYRWPVARFERGVGTVPVFLRTISAAAFADAGHAWAGTFEPGRAKLALGGEVAADMVVGFKLPVVVAAGAAWGRDFSRLVDDRWTAYLRIGRAF